MKRAHEEQGNPMMNHEKHKRAFIYECLNTSFSLGLSVESYRLFHVRAYTRSSGMRLNSAWIQVLDKTVPLPSPPPPLFHLWLPPIVCLVSDLNPPTFVLSTSIPPPPSPTPHPPIAHAFTYSLYLQLHQLPCSYSPVFVWLEWGCLCGCVHRPNGP